MVFLPVSLLSWNMLESVSLLKSLSAGIIHFGLFVNSADDNCRIGSMNSVLSEF